VPAGPTVAYYGTFTADDAAKTLTYRVHAASAPIFNGITPTQHVTLDGGKLVTTGSLVKTPQGNINPINSWRRAKLIALLLGDGRTPKVPQSACCPPDSHRRPPL
jgi:hypothetical protein